MTFLDIFTFVKRASFELTFWYAQMHIHTCKMTTLYSTRNFVFRRNENSKITFPRNVMCPYKQLIFSYASVFFKNDNCLVYGAASAQLSQMILLVCFCLKAPDLSSAFCFTFRDLTLVMTITYEL